MSDKYPIVSKLGQRLMNARFNDQGLTLSADEVREIAEECVEIVQRGQNAFGSLLDDAAASLDAQPAIPVPERPPEVAALEAELGRVRGVLGEIADHTHATRDRNFRCGCPIAAWRALQEPSKKEIPDVSTERELTSGQEFILWVTSICESSVTDEHLEIARALETRGLVEIRCSGRNYYAEATERGRQLAVHLALDVKIGGKSWHSTTS